MRIGLLLLANGLAGTRLSTASIFPRARAAEFLVGRQHRLRLIIENLMNRLNVINFAGLFSQCPAAI